MTFKIDKKIKFGAYAIAMSFFTFLFVFSNPELRWLFAVLAVTICLGGVFLVQYPYAGFMDVLAHLILPFYLTCGVFLSFYSFPNLSPILKFILVCTFGVFLYILSAINNVFIVVQDRKESIPLYRAAVTWTQIILVVISIPFFSGIFKLNIDAISQNLITGISSVFFILYLIWILKLDEDHKVPSRVEIFILSAFTFFMISVAGFSISFLPTEPFLRALFISSILMFCVNYVVEHLKNRINLNLLLQHFVFSVVFLVILLIFNS